MKSRRMRPNGACAAWRRRRAFPTAVSSEYGMSTGCVDEKSQIQALDRTQPGLPMKKGRASTMTHDYKRNGCVYRKLRFGNIGDEGPPRTGCDVMTPRRSIARWNGASLSSKR